MTNVHYLSNSIEWGTPQELFNYLDEKYHFTLDPCASCHLAKCEKYYTKNDDGLSKSWEDERVFMNPPYGREMGKWIRKASFEKSDICVCLIPARTDTKWWHKYIMKKAKEITFIQGRVRFNGNTKKNAAPFPSAIIIFKNKEEKRTQFPLINRLDLKEIIE